jgi:hypothetical protein
VWLRAFVGIASGVLDRSSERRFYVSASVATLLSLPRVAKESVMFKPLPTLLALVLVGAAGAVSAPDAVAGTDATTAQPVRPALATGKTAEKKARPKANKRPRKASHAEAPASGSK